MSQFTDHMDAKANDIAKTMTPDKTVSDWEREAQRIGEMMVRATGGAWRLEKDGCKNVKPFYNPRWMFEPNQERVKRVFVGIHPAGDPFRPLESNPCGDMLVYLDDQPSEMPHNQWIDGCWAGKGPRHQSLVKKVFKSLYGKAVWERKLRKTPSFNICPIRLPRHGSVPKPVWGDSIKLCEDIVKNLRPKTIICNGYGEKGNSPWAVIKRKFGFETRECLTERGKTVLKWGTVRGIAEGGTTVIGLPHLTSQWFVESLFCKLQDPKTKIKVT